MNRENICCYCKHMRGSFRTQATCAAFPGGIPQQIASGEVEHTIPVPGDHGIRFEPLPEFQKTHGSLVREKSAA